MTRIERERSKKRYNKEKRKRSAQRNEQQRKSKEEGKIQDRKEAKKRKKKEKQKWRFMSMQNKKFPLGVWGGALMTEMGKTPVKDLAECGMSLCMAPQYRPGIDKLEEMTAFLDECQENGIQLIIVDPRCGWDGAAETPEIFKAKFQELLEEYGRHPAVYGYYVGDEPGSDQMADAIAAVRIIKEMIPEKVPYLNFNPYWDANENTLGGKNFDEWIDSFVQESGMEQLSYDCYSQMVPVDASESGIHGYFKSMKHFMEAAKRNNVPLWVINLSSGHFRYRCPNEDDFRWQLNTSVASGAKCVWWFLFYLRMCRINYRLAPIDECGEKTETYTWLARVQNFFQKQFGALFTELEHDETYHCGKAYGGYPLLEYKRHPLIHQVTCEHNLPSMISFFHQEDGTKYMAIVNTSQSESGYFRCLFSPEVKGLHRVTYSEKDIHRGASGTRIDAAYPYQKMPWGGYEVNCARNDVCNNYSVDHEGRIQNSAWLAPGQMEVFRVVTEK